MGMPHKDIPNLLGRVLSGTKYGVKQTRGKFGLGAKMALIWSKMSTGLPIEIWSAKKGQSVVSHYKLDIDIHKWVTATMIQSLTASQYAHNLFLVCKLLREICYAERDVLCWVQE